jgi:tetratricopeptide (TPR) repeat protein
MPFGRTWPCPWNNVADIPFDLGRREEALTADPRWCLEIYPGPGRRAARRLSPDLAMSLETTLANSLSALGRREEALTAAQECRGYLRDLAAARPDAFRPNLAMSLGAMGQVYVSQENHQAGAECFKEGLATILPFFKRLPTAFVRITAALARDYSEACAKSGIEPDGKVMTEAAEVFQALEKEGEEKDHTEG